MEEKFSHAEGPEAARNSPYQTKEDLNNLRPFSAFDLNRIKGKYTLCREEKLKSRKLIQQLFEEGKSVSKDGFTLYYLPANIPVVFPAQVAFSVPKRNFKHAVDRNRMKRLMREVYRLNKVMLYEKLVSGGTQMALMWVFKRKQLPDYRTTEVAMKKCMEKLADKMK